MAGGMDWFRWHHGSVNDQKFPLVARRAGSSVAEVIAVWACLLERASENESARGSLGDSPDFEAMDCALGLPEGRSLAIFQALEQRDLVSEMRITAWDKRQPKREDSTAAERQRAKRERDAAEKCVTEANVTQRHAASRDVTLEERREEKRNTSPSLRSGERTQARASAPMRPDDVPEAVWGDWLQLRKAKKAPVTATVLEHATRESVKAGMPLADFLRVWCARGSQGLEADWLKPHERAGPGTRAPTAAEQRVLQASPALAAPHLKQKNVAQLTVFEMEPANVAPRSLDKPDLRQADADLRPALPRPLFGDRP